MKFFAISDLHLSSTGRTMDRFGNNWRDHPRKLRENWQRRVAPQDVVFVPGDLDWGRNFQESAPTYEFLARLPGRKYVVKGNHDRGMSDEKRVKRHFASLDSELSSLRLIYRDSQVIEVDGIRLGVAGTRGWSRRSTDVDDEKILNRELTRMRRSLDTLPDVDRLVVLTHFPPTEEVKRGFLGKIPDCEPGDLEYAEEFDDRMMDLIVDAGASTVICGHVHTYRIVNPQTVRGVRVYCVPADALDFDPLEVTPL